MIAMANIELPKDAEGREILRSTEAMYDINGKKVRISSFTYKCDVHGLFSQWKVFSPDIRGEKDGMLPADSLYLTPPDSWEKPEEDLRRGADAESYSMCKYANGEEFLCSECRFLRSEGCCTRVNKALADIFGRIRRLRGEGE